MAMASLPNFFAAIERLGTNNGERAAKLDMTGRSLEKWKYQGVPRVVRALVNHPDLLHALLTDAQVEAKQTSQPS